MRSAKNNKEIKEFFEKAALNWQNKDDEALIKELLVASKIKKGDVVLDVGCGKGIITPFIYDITGKTVKAIDISENMISGAKEKNSDNAKFDFQCHDFYNFFDDNKYDFVIFYNAYPHFLDRKALASRAYGLLKENGRLVIAHGMARSALLRHHQGLNPKISRELASPDEEKLVFLDHFMLEVAIDDDRCYLMVLKKQ